MLSKVPSRLRYMIYHNYQYYKTPKGTTAHYGGDDAKRASIKIMYSNCLYCYTPKNLFWEKSNWLNVHNSAMCWCRCLTCKFTIPIKQGAERITIQHVLTLKIFNIFKHQKTFLSNQTNFDTTQYQSPNSKLLVTKAGIGQIQTLHIWDLASLYFKVLGASHVYGCWVCECCKHHNDALCSAQPPHMQATI